MVARREAGRGPGEPVVHSLEPLNAETPREALELEPTPVRSLFVRCHFAIPVAPRAHRLTIEGAVERPLSLELGDLRRYETVTRRVTLECAGNGRRTLEPRPEGVAWGHFAAGTVDVTGVRLADVLAEAGLRDEAQAVLATGLDRGAVGSGRVVAFERALPRALSSDPATLLVWAFDGEPLSAAHGAPLRLVVPGRYAVDSVKWLARLTALAAPFEGYFQNEDYVYRRPGVRDEEVGAMRVRSIFVWPGDSARLRREPVELTGLAWSGAGEVTQVDVSDDGGATWRSAELAPAPSPGVAARWRFSWTPPRSGSIELAVRAFDAMGARQPESPWWNERGYGNNAVHRVRVDVD